MAWVAIGAATIGAAGSIGAASIAGKGKKGNNYVPPPPFYEDPYYKDSQDFLSGFGKDILSGKLPAYYAPIGESGGAEFEKLLALSNRDISRSAEEAAAATGRGRGGSLPGVIAPAIAENETRMRYADFMRSLEGRAGLLNTGIGIEEGVRSGSLENQGQRNNYQLGAASQALNALKYSDERSDIDSQNKGAFFGNIFNSVGDIAGAASGQGSGGSQGIADLLDKLFGKKNASPINVATSQKRLPGSSAYGLINIGG